jgi:RNA polymerase primary sigma factor
VSLRLNARSSEQRPPRMSRDAERALVMEAQAGARDELIEVYVPLIASVARIYRGSSSVDHRELMQEGVVGLLRALQRYDPTMDTPFWAYASWWVRQAMQQLVSELGRPVVLSDRALRQLARVKDAQREHLQRCGREPTINELASEAGLRRQQVEHLFVAERKPRGLEEAAGGSDEGSTTVGELLADPVAEDAYDRVPWHVEVQAVRALLSELSERERTIVAARYGLDGPERTLRELSATVGVSAERVRQIEQGALEKLREAVDHSVDRIEARPTCAGEPRSKPRRRRKERVR